MAGPTQAPKENQTAETAANATRERLSALQKKFEAMKGNVKDGKLEVKDHQEADELHKEVVTLKEQASSAEDQKQADELMKEIESVRQKESNAESDVVSDLEEDQPKQEGPKEFSLDGLEKSILKFFAKYKWAGSLIEHYLAHQVKAAETPEEKEEAKKAEALYREFTGGSTTVHRMNKVMENLKVPLQVAPGTGDSVAYGILKAEHDTIIREKVEGAIKIYGGKATDVQIADAQKTAEQSAPWEKFLTEKATKYITKFPEARQANSVTTLSAIAADERQQKRPKIRAKKVDAPEEKSENSES